MRILTVNNHYFVRGGPDRYLFNLEKALPGRGIEVVPFSFDYEETQSTAYREFFPEPITGYGPCQLEDRQLNLREKIFCATFILGCLSGGRRLPESCIGLCFNVVVAVRQRPWFSKALPLTGFPG